MLRPIAPSACTSSRSCLTTAVRPLRLVRRPIGTRSSVHAVPEESSSRPFFNRETETRLLLNLIKSRPTVVTLMVGPRNCGKTALLVHVAATLNALQKGPRVFYLDCMKSDVTSPQLLASALDMLLPRWLPSPYQSSILRWVFNALSTVGFEWGGIKLDMSKLVADGRIDEVKLVKVLNIFEHVLITLGKETGRKPVIIIDEANLLTLWDDARQLQVFTNWVVRITKQTGQCHVILATAEFGFQTWVSNTFGGGNWRPVVIGNLPEEEAGEFFEAMLQQVRKQHSTALLVEGGITSNMGTMTTSQDKASSLDKAQGLDKAVLANKEIRDMVYEVTGGNAALLLQATDLLETADVTLPNVSAVLEELVQDDMRRLIKVSAGGIDYTRTQFELVFDRLAASKYRAVGYATIIDALSEGGAADGENVLVALIKANIVSSRPKSKWDCEIPDKAFDDELMPGGRHDQVITAASVLDLHRWKKIRAAPKKAA